MAGSPRICSLLPSATEIVCALGLRDSLVAVTHECDYPPGIEDVPSVTSSIIDSAGLTSRGVDEMVRRSLENLSTIYHLDRDHIARLQPDLIVTQELCDVCAVSFEQVDEAARSLCPGARIVSLEPETVEGIFATIRQVGGACEVETVADGLILKLRERCERVRHLADFAARRPSVLTLEWVDPPFIGGHWVPDMVDLAGGSHPVGRSGERSRRIEWTEAIAAQPDVIVLMPCGYDLRTTLDRLAGSDMPAELSGLRAQAAGGVFAVNGSAYFNRPGPRIVDGVEILATIIHPDLFGEPQPYQAVRL